MMPRAWRLHRPGFSLLEIIIATAVLAASAMVLTSLLGLGTKFGNRAEARTLAMLQAQSLMDEVLALPQFDRNLEEEITGELPGAPSRTFRITLAPFGSLSPEQLPASANAEASSLGESSGTLRLPQLGKLTRITVEIFESENSGPNSARNGGDQSAEPTIRIARLVRSHRLLATTSPSDAFERGTP